MNGHFSGLTSTSISSPWGCVLSPLLYILYTNDCRSEIENHHIVKAADDMVTVSLLPDECLMALDMCIDFRHHHSKPVNTKINGQDAEIVESYRYLGTVNDNKLSFDCSTNILCKKSQHCLFCLRKLAEFGVDRSLMTLFYRSFIESMSTFSFICWYASVTLKQKNAVTKVIRVCSSIAVSDLAYGFPLQIPTSQNQQI